MDLFYEMFYVSIPISLKKSKLKLILNYMHACNPHVKVLLTTNNYSDLAHKTMHGY